MTPTLLNHLGGHGAGSGLKIPREQSLAGSTPALGIRCTTSTYENGGELVLSPPPSFLSCICPVSAPEKKILPAGSGLLNRDDLPRFLAVARVELGHLPHRLALHRRVRDRVAVVHGVRAVPREGLRNAPRDSRPLKIPNGGAPQ